MSPIKNIRTLSFFLEPGRNQLDFTYNTLSIPQRWQQMIWNLKDLALRGGGKQQPSTKLLNQLLIALFPQLISVEQSIRTDKVWLYSRETIDHTHLKMVFSAWLKSEYERMKLNFPNELSSEIFEINLDWKQENKNLITNTCNKWNTADVINESFSLVPELIGDYISQPGFTIDFKSKVLSFRRAPNPSGSGGCELISWSPEDFNGHAYSVNLNFTLQTIPYQSFPVIHLTMGIRRWVSMNDANLGSGKHSVYLLTSFPGTSLTDHSQRFQVTKIKWEKTAGVWGLVWDNLLPELFERIYMNQTLPSANEIRQTPLNYIDVPGLNAAIPFHNTMPAWQHKAAPGLTLADRRNLSEQIAPKLFDAFGLIHTEAPEKVSAFSLRKVSNEFFSSKKLSEAGKKENNSNRRKIVAQTAGKSFRLEIWYQTEMIRNALFEGVAQNLGFEIPRKRDLSEGHLFNSDELSVQIQFYDLGDLANDLDCTGNTDREIESATRRRADQVVSTIDPAVFDDNGIKPVIGAFIELPGADSYKGSKESKDPKTALRAGFARTSRFTQFITPKEEELEHRAKMATLDLLRQFGVQSGHPLQTQKLFGTTVDYAAFWLYKPREDRQYFVPMFLHMCGKTGRIRATALGFGEFLSYPEFLLSFGIPGKMKVLDYKDKGKIPGIIKDWLKEVSGDSDLMLLVSAQNARNNWNWLKNPQIAIDKVCFDNEQEIDISDWKGLRIIRVRESENGETPGFYAFKESENNELKDEKVVSFTEGVFKVTDRVFYSVGRKPKQQMKLRRMASKADNPDLNSWNPSIVELTAACIQTNDDPRHWAMLAHRLRDYAIQTDENLSLPLPLHLLKMAQEYSKVGFLLAT